VNREWLEDEIIEASLACQGRGAMMYLDQKIREYCKKVEKPPGLDQVPDEVLERWLQEFRGQGWHPAIQGLKGDEHGM
jgi:hypothetical protein